MKNSVSRWGYWKRRLRTAGQTLPDGWKAGDTCYMVTNKRKGYTSAYTVQGHDGKYFRLLNSTGNLYRASAWRMFRSSGEALESLKGKGGGQDEA